MLLYTAVFTHCKFQRRNSVESASKVLDADCKKYSGGLCCVCPTSKSMKLHVSSFFPHRVFEISGWKNQRRSSLYKLCYGFPVQVSGTQNLFFWSRIGCPCPIPRKKRLYEHILGSGHYGIRMIKKKVLNSGGDLNYQ